MSLYDNLSTQVDEIERLDGKLEDIESALKYSITLEHQSMIEDIQGIIRRLQVIRQDLY